MFARPTNGVLNDDAPPVAVHRTVRLERTRERAARDEGRRDASDRARERAKRRDEGVVRRAEVTMTRRSAAGRTTAGGRWTPARVAVTAMTVVTTMMATVVMTSDASSVSTGAPLSGATNGAADAVLDFFSTPGGRCSPNDSTNTVSCDKLEPPARQNWASFNFKINDVNGDLCDRCGRECSLDGSAWAYCGATPVTYTGLSLGNHQFKVRGLGGDNTPDPTPAVYDWIVESPFEVDWDSLYSTPSSYLTSNAAITFRMESSGPSSSTVQFEYSTTNDYIKTYTRLSNGVKTVTVTPSFGYNMFAFRAISVETYAGQSRTEMSTNEIALTYIVDNVNPTVSFISGLADGAAAPTSSLSYSVSSKDIDTGGSTVQSGLATLEVQLTRPNDGASSPSPLQTWTTHHTYTNGPIDEDVTVILSNLGSLSDATYRVEIRVTDRCGNVATTIQRDFDIQLSSVVSTPDDSALDASTTERLQTTSGAIKLASQPSDGSVVPVAYEVSAIVGGQLVLESALSVPLTNNTLVSASDALNGFRFTPGDGLHTNDEYLSTFGFDLKPSTSTSDLSQVVDLPAHSTITVTSTNDPPVLDVNAHYEVPAIAYTDTGNVGSTFKDVLGANVIDYDAFSSLRRVPHGVALVGADQTHGTWQYSTDGRSTWTNFGDSLSETSATLLTATDNDCVRFVPDVATLDDQFVASFAFKGWDGTTSESAGSTGVDITTSTHTATTGSISVATVTANILVRGSSYSLFEKSNDIETRNARTTYDETANTCPPDRRRAIRIPVRETSETSACSGSTSGSPRIISSSTLAVSPPWTIEAWVRRDAWLSEQVLFESSSDASGIMLEMAGATGKIGVIPPTGVTGGTFNYQAPLGVWVHLAFVMYENNHPAAYSSPGANLRLIVDGTFHSELTNVGFAMPHGTIGGNGLVGFSIDEVRYWSIARSTEDIHTNMERFMGGTETGLASYVPFDAGCGSTVSDRVSGSSATWTLTYHEWVVARDFTCASVVWAAPSIINTHKPSQVSLIGERFRRPASWGSSSVSHFDGTNAVCIFGSSTHGSITTIAKVVSDTEILCDPPSAADGIASVLPVFCDYSMGCCSGETPVDYFVTSRPYDSTYVSAGANSLPTYDQSVLTYSRGEITSVMPSTVDWALGSVITVIGYGFAQPAGSGFYHPRCTFERDGNFHFATNATIVSDTMARCEYPGSYAPDTLEARQTVELILTFNFPPGKSLNIYGGWMTVVISSYTVYAGPDQPLNAISELGGSVVSVTITHGKGDASGAFVDHVSGKVSSFDVACAFGTIRPISARYNESETFECVSPAATQSASAAIPLFVTLFASSMLTSFTKWNALTSTGDIHYSAHPVVSAIWPPTVFSVATSAPTFQIVGSNFPSLSPRCQLDEKDVGATWLNAERVRCNTANFGGSLPGFRAVYVDNHLLRMGDTFVPSDVHVMVRDDVYVGGIVSAGALGPLYGGWSLTLSGSGFLPGDGVSLHIAANGLSEINDPNACHWLSSSLMKCLAPKVEENSVNWDMTQDGGGWMTQLVARLAVETFDDSLDGTGPVVKVVDGINNASSVANLYAAMTSIELLSSPFLSVDGGTEVSVLVKNGTASTLSTVCRFGAIQVLADWLWSNVTTTTRMRCISPAFGSYDASEIRFTVSQGDPGHHGEVVLASGLTRLKYYGKDDITHVSSADYFEGSFSSAPSAQKALYECYMKGDRDRSLASLTVDSSNSDIGYCSWRAALGDQVFRTDIAFVTMALAVRGGEDIALPFTFQYVTPPLVSSVTVSALAPPYGYRPAFADSDCTRLEDVTSVSEEFSHEVYEGRPETPYETEKFVLPALKIFGGAWWHVSNAFGMPVNVNGRYFRSLQDGGTLRVSFEHTGKTTFASAHRVSSALIRVEIPSIVDAEHDTVVRVSTNDGVTWSPERAVFRIPELDYVDRDLQIIQQGCA